MTDIRERIESLLDRDLYSIERVPTGFDESRAVVPIVPRTEPAARREVNARIHELAQQGKPIPDDVAQPIIDARAADALAIARAVAINTAADEIAEIRQGSNADRLPQLFAAMTAELERIVDEVKALAPRLDGATTPDGAIDTGPDAVEAWQQLRRLTTDYSDVRNLQQKHTLVAIGQDAGDRKNAIGMLMSVGLFRNAIDIAPVWMQARGTAWDYALDPTQHPTAARYDAWLKDGRTGMGRWSDADVKGWEKSWWPTARFGGHEGFLLWIAEYALPYAPEPDKLEEIHLNARLTTELWRDPATLPARIDALERYCKLAEVEPPFAIPNERPSHEVSGNRVGARSPEAHRVLRERIGTPS